MMQWYFYLYGSPGPSIWKSLSSVLLSVHSVPGLYLCSFLFKGDLCSISQYRKRKTEEEFEKKPTKWLFVGDIRTGYIHLKKLIENITGTKSINQGVLNTKISCIRTIVAGNIENTNEVLCVIITSLYAFLGIRYQFPILISFSMLVSAIMGWMTLKSVPVLTIYTFTSWFGKSSPSPPARSALRTAL